MPKRPHLKTTGIDYGLGVITQNRGNKVMNSLRSTRRDAVYRPDEELIALNASKAAAEADALAARQWRLWFQRMKLEADRRDTAAGDDRSDRTRKSMEEEKIRISNTIKLAESKLIKSAEPVVSVVVGESGTASAIKARAAADSADSADSDSGDSKTRVRVTRGERRRQQNREKDLLKLIRIRADESYVLDSCVADDAHATGLEQYKTQIKELRSAQRSLPLSHERWAIESKLKAIEQKRTTLISERNNPKPKTYLTRPNPTPGTAMTTQPTTGSIFLRTALVGAQNTGLTSGDEKVTASAMGALLASTAPVGVTSEPAPDIHSRRYRRDPTALRAWQSAAAEPAAALQPRMPNRIAPSGRTVRYQGQNQPYSQDGHELWWASAQPYDDWKRGGTYRSTTASGVAAEFKAPTDRHPTRTAQRALRGWDGRQRRNELESHLHRVGLRARQFQVSSNKHHPSSKQRDKRSSHIHGREKRAAKKSVADPTAREVKQIASAVAEQRVVNEVMNVGSRRVVPTKPVDKLRKREISAARTAGRDRKALALARPETIVSDTQIDPYESDLEEIERRNEQYESELRATDPDAANAEFGPARFTRSRSTAAARVSDGDSEAADATVSAVPIRKPKDTGDGKHWAVPTAAATATATAAAAVASAAGTGSEDETATGEYDDAEDGGEAEAEAEAEADPADDEDEAAAGDEPESDTGSNFDAEGGGGGEDEADASGY